MYLLVAVEATSLFMRRLPHRVGRAIHLTGCVVFSFATFHLPTAGTATNPVSRVATTLVIAVIVFLTLVSALSGRSS